MPSLPGRKENRKPTPESIDSHKAPEWFEDSKFGMFIDWGTWSRAGWAPKQAKGGNLLLIVNLDGQGALPKVQEKRLRDIEKWLKVNGEGIYATRSFTRQFDDQVAYTRSKGNQYVYAIMKKSPGSELRLKEIQPSKGSKIEMLGYSKPFTWMNIDGGVAVKIPDELQDESNRPCEHAWVLKIKLDDIQ